MKKILSLALVAFTAISFIAAQPQKMTYQTVVRDVNNNLVVNQQVGVRINIVEDSINGFVAYAETHIANTNANALLSIQIGTGTRISVNTFNSLDWAGHDYFVKAEIDPTGGALYSISGSEQLLTVPYSFYATRTHLADSAAFASTAISANTANYADSTRIANAAITANAALTANYADSARVANSSNTANTANSALTANYADSARISNSAIVANTANYADSTRIANAALTANYADSARIANSSNTANTANSALTANYADSTRISNSAISANTANYADSTRIANTAISANNSNNAINAINATHSDSSLYANTSRNAINAVNATYADTADFNKLLNRPVGVNKGDILYWETNDNSWHLVPAGNSGEVLAMGSNNVPQWAAISNGGNTPTNNLAITTNAVTGITGTAATTGGNVTSDGGDMVTERGICWNNAGNPTLADNVVIDGGIGTGSFTMQILGLTPEKKYYMRAYAINSTDTAYGEIFSFTTLFVCGYNKVTDKDGNEYGTLPLGTQCWMRENLRVTQYADGTQLSIGGSTTSTNVAQAYHAGGDPSNDSKYGLLYNWTAATRGITSSANPSGLQGICPMGWHIPSNAEWIQLTDYVSSQVAYIAGGATPTYIAKSLAATTDWTTSSTSYAVGRTMSNNNKTGFGALPAGRYTGTTTYSILEYAYFWTTFESGNNAYCYYLFYNSYSVSSAYFDKGICNSVRCVKD